MQGLFEANINQTADALPRTIDAETILTSAPYITYEQFKLGDNFRTYLEYCYLNMFLEQESELHRIKNPSS